MRRLALLSFVSLFSNLSLAAENKLKFNTFKGSFHSFAKAEGADKKIIGTVQMQLGPKGTDFKMHVEGLSPSKGYISHVHLLKCSDQDAGGHYMQDPKGKVGEANEIWFHIPAKHTSFKTDKSIAHIVREDARSIVVHENVAGMPKLACADLEALK